jgi:hypothetical protein
LQEGGLRGRMDLGKLNERGRGGCAATEQGRKSSRTHPCAHFDLPSSHVSTGTMRKLPRGGKCKAKNASSAEPIASLVALKQWRGACRDRTGDGEEGAVGGSRGQKTAPSKPSRPPHFIGSRTPSPTDNPGLRESCRPQIAAAPALTKPVTKPTLPTSRRHPRRLIPRTSTSDAQIETHNLLEMFHVHKLFDRRILNDLLFLHDVINKGECGPLLNPFNFHVPTCQGRPSHNIRKALKWRCLSRPLLLSFFLT